MKFSPSPTALSVEIRPSRIFCFALSTVALFALAAIFHATVPIVLRAWLATAALLYAWFCLRTHRRQRGRLLWHEGWIWIRFDGVECALQLRSATLWPGLIVLQFRDLQTDAAKTRRSLTFTLWRDSLDSEAARRLRVYLRHAPVFGT